jgi:hypothetical protein
VRKTHPDSPFPSLPFGFDGQALPPLQATVAATARDVVGGRARELVFLPPRSQGQGYNNSSNVKGKNQGVRNHFLLVNPKNHTSSMPKYSDYKF